MKIEWLVVDATAVRSLDRAERAILGLIVTGRVFGQSRSFCWSGSRVVVCETPLELLKLYLGSFNKNRVVVDQNVTAIGGPDRAKRAVLGGHFAWAFFGQFGTHLWTLSHFVM